MLHENAIIGMILVNLPVCIINNDSGNAADFPLIQIVEGNCEPVPDLPLPKVMDADVRVRGDTDLSLHQVADAGDRLNGDTIEPTSDLPFADSNSGDAADLSLIQTVSDTAGVPLVQTIEGNCEPVPDLQIHQADQGHDSNVNTISSDDEVTSPAIISQQRNNCCVTRCRCARIPHPSG